MPPGSSPRPAEWLEEAPGRVEQVRDTTIEGSLNTYFISERNFANVSTRSSSLFQGESEVSLKTPAIYSL